MPDSYLKAFSRLTRSPNPLWTSATKKKAPHKPLLLLAILDLIAQGQIQTNFIELTPDLRTSTNSSTATGPASPRRARRAPSPCLSFT